MAKLNVAWKTTRLISVFEEARALGFDLRKYDDLHVDVQVILKRATVARVLQIIRDTWDQAVSDTTNKNWFAEVTSGVYVISIGQGFGVTYGEQCSEVMYIGRGAIASRLRSHLHNWIFDMSKSLRDVPFKFYMEEFSDQRSKDAFKDFEHWLLERFHDKFGEKPLVNKIGGREGRIEHSFGGNCAAPLNNNGKSYLWQIRPTRKNRWFKPVADD